MSSPSALRIDAHQHFWKYDAAQYPWIPPGSALHRDWLPADLAAVQEPLGVHGSVAVQARQSEEESRWLLELAEGNPRIAGVVGWVDLRDPGVEESLARWASNPKFVGVRHVVQDEPDDAFMLGAEFQRGVGLLERFGLRYDLLIYPRQLPAAVELVARFPLQRFVLDHGAKPPLASGVLGGWERELRRLAQAPNVWCKVSGLVTEADWERWDWEGIRPALEVIVEAFGPRRLMWGSDWPVCLHASSYERWLEGMERWTQAWSTEERAGFFGENAARFYGIAE